MGEDGTGCAYEYDGLSPEAAIGYLTTVIDQLRDEVKERWEAARASDFTFSVQLECPECGEEINISNAEYADDDEEDEGE